MSRLHTIAERFPLYVAALGGTYVLCFLADVIAQAVS